MKEKKHLVEYCETLPSVYEFKSNECMQEPIQIHKPGRRIRVSEIFIKYWRFVSLVTAFAAIFLLVYSVFSDDRDSSYDSLANVTNESDFATTEHIVLDKEISGPEYILPLLMNEAKADITIEDILEYSYDSCIKLNTVGDFKVLLLHTHSSEMVSENVSVYEAGTDLEKLLTASGITVLHSNEQFDEAGRIGSYNRMKTYVKDQIKKHPEILIVIDLHGSQEVKQLLFDVGVTPVHTWKENLKLITGIYGNMGIPDCAIRLLPTDLGQDNGILSLNVSLGCDTADDEYARTLISALALGIIELVSE